MNTIPSQCVYHILCLMFSYKPQCWEMNKWTPLFPWMYAMPWSKKMLNLIHISSEAIANQLSWNVAIIYCYHGK